MNSDAQMMMIVICQITMETMGMSQCRSLTLMMLLVVVVVSVVVGFF